MEEWVRRQWHRFITSVAEQRAPHAAVHLADMQRTIGLLFRAGGGDSGTRIAQAGRSREPITIEMPEKAKEYGE